MKQFWQVTVDLLGVELTPDELDRLVDELADVGAAVAARDGRLSVTLTAHAETEMDAFSSSIERVREHVAPRATIASVELLTDEEADRRLAEPAFPELVGIAEIAELLGVSRQRASELQTRPGFPAPVAVLRSGPVWRKGDLSAFASTWERKPGRPRKVAGAIVDATRAGVEAASLELMAQRVEKEHRKSPGSRSWSTTFSPVSDVDIVIATITGSGAVGSSSLVEALAGLGSAQVRDVLPNAGFDPADVDELGQRLAQIAAHDRAAHERRRTTVLEWLREHPNERVLDLKND